MRRAQIAGDVLKFRRTAAWRPRLQGRAMTALVVAILTLTAAWLAPASAAAATPSLKLQSERRIDGRLVDLQLRAPRRGANAVRVLPKGYARTKRRYPVLYLLHGAVDDYTPGRRRAAERITAGLRLIVVFDSLDRVAATRTGTTAAPAAAVGLLHRPAPAVHRQALPRPPRAGRAVAGLSMGGGGAMSYAARHPDLFTARGSRCGGLTHPAIVGVPASRRWTLLDAGGPLADPQPGRPGGEPRGLGLDPSPWTAGGPLGGSTRPGRGRYPPGRGGTPRTARATRNPAPLDDYWARQPRLALLAARPARDPAAADGRRRGRRPDASHAHRRRARLRRLRLARDHAPPSAEFSTLRDADAHGFRLTGSGSATVVTPAAFHPSAPIR